MLIILISTFFFCGIATFPHESGAIIKGPSSSVIIRGPDGSVIKADAVGGVVSVGESTVLEVPGSVEAISPGTPETSVSVNVEPVLPENSETPSTSNTEPSVPGTSDTPGPPNVEPVLPGNTEVRVPGNAEPAMPENSGTLSPGNDESLESGSSKTPSPVNETPTEETSEDSSDVNGKTETPSIDSTTPTENSQNENPLTDEVPLETPPQTEEIELSGRSGRISGNDFGVVVSEPISALVKSNNNEEKVQSTAQEIRNESRKRLLEKFLTGQGLQPMPFGFIPRLYGNPEVENFILPRFPLVW